MTQTRHGGGRGQRQAVATCRSAAHKHGTTGANLVGASRRQVPYCLPVNDEQIRESSTVACRWRLLSAALSRGDFARSK